MAKFLDQINRGADLLVLPDGRRRAERRYDITDWQAAYPNIEKFEANVQLDWGVEDPEYTGLRLTQQHVVGQTENPNKSPNDPPPHLLRVYEEIPENDRVIVGLPGVSINQYGFTEVVITYIQFSSGTTSYDDTVGTSAAPTPYDTAILKTVEGDNNGTIRTYKLTYTTGGEMGDHSEIRFGGKMIIRTLKYLNMVPPTPSGYTLVGPGVEFVGGLPMYEYQYAAATGGGGAGDYIGIETQYVTSPNQGATGVTVKTIRAVVPQGGSDPITSPGTGYQLIDEKYEDDTGVRMWTAIFAKGQGTISTDITYKEKGNLVIYAITAINAAPSAPSPTIGGTVVLISTSVRNGSRLEDGTTIFEYRWAEGNGTISTETQGEPDGAIVQSITTLTAASSTPTSPGMGWYLEALTNSTQDGCYINRARYKKPPADDTYKKTMEFEHPGIAEFVGSPPQFVLHPPKQRTLLVNVAVTYSTSQDSTTPFEIEAYGSFYETYTPTDTGVAVQNQKGLGGYLAQASGISGTNSNYNGVLCDSWAASLLSSIPSTFPTGLVTIKVDNDPYLTDVNGVKVYRRTVITYTF